MTDRRSVIEAFTRAWDARDLDAVMALMASDCRFHSSVGPGPGAEYQGRAAVAKAFGAFLSAAPNPDVTSGPVEMLIGGDFAVTRWTTRTELPGTAPVLTAACDVFEFDGVRIAVKDTYRKVLGPAPA